jgi:hypothetical protein
MTEQQKRILMFLINEGRKHLVVEDAEYVKLSDDDQLECYKESEAEAAVDAFEELTQDIPFWY